ncbi:MAG: GNAT family N-acetyltransferase [Arenimonas sp.]
MMQTFETARLLMRPLAADDRDLYCFCYTDPSMMKLIAAPLTMDAALRSFEVALKINSHIPVRRRDWIMLEKTSGSCIGLLSLVGCKTKPVATNADLGAIILSTFQGKGYSLEGTGALVDAAFAISHIDALHTHHQSENAAVGRVMSKLGFNATVERDGEIENYHWKLLRTEWQSNIDAMNLNEASLPRC